MPCLRLPATIAPMKPTECLRVLLAAFALGASSPVTAQDDVLVLRIDDIEPVAGAPVIVRVYDRAGWLQPEKALRTLAFASAWANQRELFVADIEGYAWNCGCT